jgi:hypothetical protein
MLTQNAIEVLKKLCDVAHSGPIPAVGQGSNAVGMTLLRAMGVDYTSTDKPRIMGIVVTARRNVSTAPRNRVNLFARVPDWKISACKSSGEIAKKHGYDGESGVRRLYCTVRASHPNSQGLLLYVNAERNSLDEIAQTKAGPVDVARWPLEDLRNRLIATHPESIWVSANVVRRSGIEHFHYRKAIYTGPPFVERLEALLAEGTVTVDHLIEVSQQGTKEKGPLFKIHPSNIPLLFPSSMVFDLLTVDKNSLHI